MKTLISTLSFIFFYSLCFGQAPIKYSSFKIRIDDGKYYYGKEFKEEGGRIIIKTLGDSLMNFKKKEVLSVNKIIDGFQYFEWKKEGFTKFVVTKVDSLKKERLYKLALAWVKETYNTPLKVIKAEIENKKIRIEAIKTNGIKEQMMGTRFFDVIYSLEVEVRDGRYKFEPLHFARYIPTNSDWLLISNGNFAEDFYNKKGEIRKAYKYFPVNSEDLFNSLNFSLYSYILKNSDNTKEDW